VTLAENTQGEAKDPASPTTTFKSTSTFHAVVHVDNAPNATKFGAAWFASDTGGIAPCNSAIDATTLESSGTRNIDFTLAPSGKWPAGTFQVQIIVNGKVAAVQNFSVK
jgi:outer membrane usher protein FimD/PapC